LHFFYLVKAREFFFHLGILYGGLVLKAQNCFGIEKWYFDIKILMSNIVCFVLMLQKIKHKGERDKVFWCSNNITLREKHVFFMAFSLMSSGFIDFECIGLVWKDIELVFWMSKRFWDVMKLQESV